jgi:DNA modification methylase
VTTKLAIDDPDVKIYLGDVVDGLRCMDDGIAQTCVTSPPYWGLRDYGVEGQIGAESTVDDYVKRMVEVFREVRRVLRGDGTLWLNLGDSFASCDTAGFKAKDLAGIPWRVAFALQADGWYLRSDIIWSKPNPMPESVTDRPTKAHEYVFLLSKSARYFYDAEAIREPDTGIASGNRERRIADGELGKRPADHLGASVPWQPDGTGRNARSVWQITTKPYAEAHFATFPVELPERCIKAGTSQAGACAECGTPIERIITAIAPDGREAVMRGGKAYDADGRPLMGDNMIDHGTRGSFASAGGKTLKRRTDGWTPTCACSSGVVPQVVLDPFMGSGTTAWIARHLGRHALGCEINSEYIDIERKRLQQLSLIGDAE